MAIPRNDREAEIWLEVIAECLECGDVERALVALSEATTYYVLLNARLDAQAACSVKRYLNALR